MTLAVRWRYALKPMSWPKLIVPTLLGQALGFAISGQFFWPGLLMGATFTLFDIVYLVTLNDWGDREVDTLKRRMFPNNCSPKTIPDGILPARDVLVAGVLAGALGLAAATFLGIYFSRPYFGVMAGVALFVFFAYTLPPLKLNYRGGGEVLEMAGVGFVLPWMNGYAQSGALTHPLYWLLVGFSVLSLGSGLASGLSDEESDRAGGKRTFATLLGNRFARRGVEIVLVLGPLAWLAGLVGIESVPWWTVVLPAIVALAYGWQVQRASPQATTGAFAAQGQYKRYLHHAIWYSGVCMAALLIVATIVGAQ